ncbi:MAG TPA: hypothetical protein VJM76_03740, partial [Gammaproteobacteria bacterium]|nr:hypothetical protein [Gammaproteobacteria bacterium]
AGALRLLDVAPDDVAAPASIVQAHHEPDSNPVSSAAPPQALEIVHTRHPQPDSVPAAIAANSIRQTLQGDAQ